MTNFLALASINHCDSRLFDISKKEQKETYYMDSQFVNYNNNNNNNINKN